MKEKYLRKIEALAFTKEDEHLPKRLLIKEYSDDTFKTYYAPFDYINRKAKVVICGITPGLQQALCALIEAREQLAFGNSMDHVLFSAKQKASFCGDMRSNLVKILDNADLPRCLGIRTTDDLFGPKIQLAHFMSVLRYPVFLGTKNYSGSPSMLRRRKNVLLEHLHETFFADLESLPKASIYIPLGPKVAGAFRYAEEKGIAKDRKIIYEMPHASPENREEIKLAKMKSYPGQDDYVSEMLHKYKQKKKAVGESLTQEQIRKYKESRKNTWSKIKNFKNAFKNCI